MDALHRSPIHATRIAAMVVVVGAKDWRQCSDELTDPRRTRASQHLVRHPGERRDPPLPHSTVLDPGPVSSTGWHFRRDDSCSGKPVYLDRRLPAFDMHGAERLMAVRALAGGGQHLARREDLRVLAICGPAFSKCSTMAGDTCSPKAFSTRWRSCIVR